METFILINEFSEIYKQVDLTNKQCQKYYDSYHDIIRLSDGKQFVNGEWMEIDIIKYNEDGSIKKGDSNGS